MDTACRRPSEVIGRTDRPLVFDQEGAFIGNVAGAPVFDDPQPSGGNLLVDAMIQDDDAIRDIFFQTVPRERPIAAFPGDDCGHPFLLEPAEQPPQFGPQDGRIRKAGEEGLDRIQQDPLGPDRVDGVSQANEEPVQVVFAGLFDLAPLDANVIQGELLLTHQVVEVETQRADVFGEFFGRLLESHQHARLVELGRPADQELDAQHRLAAAGAAANQGGPPARKSATREFVESPESPWEPWGDRDGSKYSRSLLYSSNRSSRSKGNCR